MSFIKVGNYFFRKSRIAYINVSSSGLFGRNYELQVAYEMPGAQSCPTHGFAFYYDQKCLNQLFLDIDSILSGNSDCIVGPGASSILRNKNRE